MTTNTNDPNRPGKRKYQKATVAYNAETGSPIYVEALMNTTQILRKLYKRVLVSFTVDDDNRLIFRVYRKEEKGGIRAEFKG